MIFHTNFSRFLKKSKMVKSNFPSFLNKTIDPGLMDLSLIMTFVQDFSQILFLESFPEGGGHICPPTKIGGTKGPTKIGLRLEFEGRYKLWLK